MITNTEIITKENSTEYDSGSNSIQIIYYNRKVLRYAKKYRISNDKAFKILYGNKQQTRRAYNGKEI